MTGSGGRLRFSKGHGTGNDFVIVADPDGALDLPAHVVARLCDRRFGIGADGLLRVVRVAACPEVADRAGAGGPEWFMDYRNADGTVAEMCGNGARVFARYLADTGLADTGLADAGLSGAGEVAEVAMLTRSGPVTAVVGDRDAVTVEMRVPRIVGVGTAAVAGHEFAGVAVDCGNPHLVCAVPAAFDLGGLDLTAPPEVDGAAFPAGVNVEFCAPAGRRAGHVRMRVHERGVGETLSCGSGACAVAAVVLRESGVDSGVVAVDVPGGRLTVTLDGRTCRLTGAAVIVAHGTVDIGALLPPAARAG